VPDYSDQTPAWRQIAADLREQIRAGSYPPGTRLPSNIALAKRYGVATETIRSSLEELRGEGIVETRSTRGTFATGKPVPDAPPDLEALGEQVADLKEQVKDYPDLRDRVGKLEADVLHLYNSLAIDYDHGGEDDGEQKAAGRDRAGRR